MLQLDDASDDCCDRHSESHSYSLHESLNVWARLPSLPPVNSSSSLPASKARSLAQPPTKDHKTHDDRPHSTRRERRRAGCCNANKNAPSSPEIGSSAVAESGSVWPSIFMNTATILRTAMHIVPIQESFAKNQVLSFAI